jgi:hypothetical protein
MMMEWVHVFEKEEIIMTWLSFVVSMFLNVYKQIKNFSNKQRLTMYLV